MAQRFDVSTAFVRRQVVTFVGARTAGGMVASWALEEAWFLAYVEQVLVASRKPGRVVVMDNLPTHKVQGVEAAIWAAGCRREDLPPSSPDLNPIENAFPKRKRALTDWAAQTVAAVDEGLRGIITRLGSAECLNDFRHCGYAHATAASTPL